ncbi:MAG: peptide chain release factor N(5)-glutamine methyltransferase [Oscillospiraceae bacterium]|nr:peptide chain release factor N(5)-glutamine methyltransferase [Oscillospiraceae bacterium]
MFTTYNDVYLDIRRRLVLEKISMAELEAFEILKSVTGKTREEFVRDKYLHASNDIVRSAARLTERRVAGEPLAYILGEWDFYGITLKVTPDVLIPRSDTEALVDCALRRSNGAFRFLDLGCGSGCVGIALGVMRNSARGVLADISEGALEVAKENVYNNRLSSRISVIRADMTSAPPANLGKFDVLVSNPPYITTEEMKTLDKSVVEFEPKNALWGGDDGLEFYRAICENWLDVLNDGGVLAFECGIAQSSSLEKLLSGFGLKNIQTTRDTSGANRVVSCIKQVELI